MINYPILLHIFNSLFFNSYMLSFAPILSEPVTISRASTFDQKRTSYGLFSMSLLIPNSWPQLQQIPTRGVDLSSTSTVRTSSIATLYTESSFFYNIPFGSHSHWLQPWRAYSETVSAKTFLEGIGIGLDLNNQENPDLVLHMLAAHGVKTVRIEISWSKLSYSTESLANERLQAILRACKRWGIRPLILLNAHQGAPTPLKFFERKAIASASKGSRKIRLNDTSGLVIGKSGLNNLTDYWAAEALITAIDGDTVTLSKPLPKSINAGSSVSMATLKYRPFSTPESVDYSKTIEGWQRYVDTVADFVSNTLGTTQSSNKGFDMEIWNELTFGSEFLSVNNYYVPKLFKYDKDSIWSALVKATAEHVAVYPNKFSGVKFSDGFANTIPWPASSGEPVQICAISKHPYAGRKSFPKNEQHGSKINALGKPTNFIPAYSALFPEYYATAIQTETILRDAGPLQSDIYGIQHGRYARRINGQIVPTEVWITETGIAPTEDNIKDPVAALALKAKTTARYYTFYLNKGITKLYLYSAASGDLGLGIVQDNFLKYSRTHSTYPANERLYVSPALEITKHIVMQMKQDFDPTLRRTRPLQLDSISDTHNHSQFLGDGSTAHPNLYNRDVFAFLPYQVNEHRFIIPYYVMTRDVTKDLPPENFTIQVSNVKAQGATVSIYDPLNHHTLPATINRQGSDFLNLTLPTTDYPYLLILQEKP